MYFVFTFKIGQIGFISFPSTRTISFEVVIAGNDVLLTLLSVIEIKEMRKLAWNWISDDVRMNCNQFRVCESTENWGICLEIYFGKKW